MKSTLPRRLARSLPRSADNVGRGTGRRRVDPILSASLAAMAVGAVLLTAGRLLAGPRVRHPWPAHAQWTIRQLSALWTTRHLFPDQASSFRQTDSE